MAALILLMGFLSGFSFVLGLIPMEWEARPTLKGLEVHAPDRKKSFARQFRQWSRFNRRICTGKLRQRIARDLSVGHVNLSPDDFFLIKEVAIVAVLGLIYLVLDTGGNNPIDNPDFMLFWILMSLGLGYFLPEFWLRGRVKNVKLTLAKELPNAIDLLGLCVNAGLDFMLSLKWVVEKSPPSVMINELNTLLQEINVGKTRRDALRDLAAKYNIPEVSTFTRTLIQADKMGTSVSEALNILSEDMRLARFRRGEQIAMKAPLKMLVPLLLCIFPVVGILVAGPILLQFVETNPLTNLSGGG